MVTSIFFGGGTPSLLSAKQVLYVMETIRECFAVAEDAEITMEVNPGTVDADKLFMYRKAGINRLSIGLQSAMEEELKILGRIHDYNQFAVTYQKARDAGFSNINVDVMSALPGQSLESYLATLRRVLLMPDAPEHISAYSLIVEEDTPFYEMLEKGELDLPDEDTEREMYRATKEMLKEFGYQRYEISNYAKPGYECRHNCGYWQRDNYLGFGIGAASLIDNVRFQNCSDLQTYLECFGGTEDSGQRSTEKYQRKCLENMQELSAEEQMEEFMFLGLRMMEGVSPIEFKEQFGSDIQEVYGEVIRRNIEDGLLVYRKENGNERKEAMRLTLTEKGIDISNYVMAQFLLT